ncbi:MAG TPA: ATP-binding protein [Burkholderiales bacterium]|nr:ATP-binding protein [Burkholderiales bacterium]
MKRVARTRSVRGALLAWLTAAVLAGGAAAGAFVYAAALQEIDALFDYQIRQLAVSLVAQSMRFGGALLAMPDESDDEALDFAVRIRDGSGESLYASRTFPGLPRSAVLGYSDVRGASGAWRVYAMQWGTRTIEVAQPLAVRREMAFAAALRTLAPLLIVVPLLVAAVWLAVARAVRPLRRVAGAVERRNVKALQPLPQDGLPAEVLPLVAAFNGLLRRLGESIDAQRAFIGDAAHELRTPLAALRLQAQVLVRTLDPREREAAGAEFVDGVDRATRLVEQLLDLARSEPDAAARAFTPVRLDELARGAVSDHAAIAAAKGVDLGAEAADAVEARGDAQSLRILLRNLVDNAVRYTPAGGAVDVIATRVGERAALQVVDTGPGIAPEERERVFGRFYRLPGSAESGSGLGLSIVRRIAELHGAEVRLESGADGKGLKATVLFPDEPALRAR